MIRDEKEILNKLNSLSVDDTFAVNYGKFDSFDYAVVTDGPFKDKKNYYNLSLAEPYDIIMDVDLRKNPSSEHIDNCSIAHNPEDQELFVKERIGQFKTINSICLDALSVQYTTNRDIVIICQECGREIPVNFEGDFEDQNKIVRSKNMKQDNGNFVTPCCYSTEWSTELK